MTRSPIRVFAAVLLTGALLSAPSINASAVEPHRAAAERQKFVFIQGDPEATGGPIAATGPIHALGTDVVLSEFKDRFEFPDGNLIIKHNPKEGLSSESYDPVNCLFTFIERGTWKTVRGSGSYANVIGAGTYRAFGQGIACEENKPPKALIVRIVIKGPLSY